jgi:phospholipid transport system substrate-binding protein
MRLAGSKKTLKRRKRRRNDFWEEADMKKELSGLLLIILLFFPPFACSAAPVDTVKGTVDKVLEVLRDPALKEGEHAKQVKVEKIRSISEELFDFTELSKRSLGQNWNKLNAGQQEEFTKLFKSLLETTYADKIMSYADEKIIFKEEIRLSEKTVEVPTTISTKTSEIPINYRLIEKEGRWKVYDVVIEGVSLVNNYRTQFREILANKTPEAMLDILRKKVGEALAS